MNKSVLQHYLLIVVLSSILIWSCIVRIGVPFIVPNNELDRVAGWNWLFWIGVFAFGGFLFAQVQEQLQKLEAERPVLIDDILRWAKVSKVVGLLLHATGAIGVGMLWVFGREGDGVFFSLLAVGFSGFSVIDYGRKLSATVRPKSNKKVSERLLQRFHSLGVGPDADTVMARDRRHPVLYLRSFDEETYRASVSGRFGKYFHALHQAQSSDGFYLLSTKRVEKKLFLGPYRSRSLRRSLLGSQRSMFDEQLVFAEFMDLIGPYIAIGRPNEIFSNMDLGAAKKYVSDADWQNVVIEWLTNSAAVILDVGTSKGFLWEVEQVTRISNPKKLLLILPWQQQDYDSFLEATIRLFPKRLPSIRPPSRLLTFKMNWEPLILHRPSDDVSLEGTLRPFVQQNGFILKRAQ